MMARAIRILQRTETVRLVVGPLAFVDAAGGRPVASVAEALSAEPVALVAGAVARLEQPLAGRQVVRPVAAVDALVALERAAACPDTRRELADVAVAVREHELAAAVALAVLPLAPVDGAVRPGLFPVAVRAPAHPVAPVGAAVRPGDRALAGVGERFRAYRHRPTGRQREDGAAGVVVRGAGQPFRQPGAAGQQQRNERCGMPSGKPLGKPCGEPFGKPSGAS